LLTVSALPDAVTNIAVAVLRVTNRMHMALLLNASMLVGCVVSAWIVLPSTGIIGAGVCWLLSQTVGAMWVIANWRRIVGGAKAAVADVPQAVAADVLPAVVEGVDR